MREILFRGKEYKGDWYEGFLFQIQLEGASWCIGLEPLGANDYSEIYTSDYAEVIPETVGQYTGLKDKNGVKIFEGDIVHCISRFDDAKMVVIFEEGEFRMVLLEKIDSYVVGGGFYALRCFEKEVIGNIHDSRN